MAEAKYVDARPSMTRGRLLPNDVGYVAGLDGLWKRAEPISKFSADRRILDKVEHFLRGIVVHGKVPRECGSAGTRRCAKKALD
jgi:hypothetical protein